MTNIILNVKKLNVQFNHETILENINFSVHKGDIFVLVGPNGAGKSTLLRALLNLVEYSGVVKWSTQNVSYLPPHETLNQKEIPPLTVQDFFLCKKKANKKEIPSLLESVGLETNIQTKQFSELSTGQFQRMLIAWALANKPSVLLLDDPATAIDTKGQKIIYELLHKLWKEKKLTLIIVTHDLDVVWQYATQVLCMNKTIMCQGKPQATLTPENLKKLYGWGAMYEHKHS